MGSGSAAWIDQASRHTNRMLVPQVGPTVGHIPARPAQPRRRFSFLASGCRACPQPPPRLLRSRASVGISIEQSVAEARRQVQVSDQKRLGPVAQWLEPTAHNGLVVGSSPARPTKSGNDSARNDGLRCGFVNLTRSPLGFTPLGFTEPDGPRPVGEGLGQDGACRRAPSSPIRSAWRLAEVCDADLQEELRIAQRGRAPAYEATDFVLGRDRPVDQARAGIVRRCRDAGGANRDE